MVAALSKSARPFHSSRKLEPEAGAAQGCRYAAGYRCRKADHDRFLGLILGAGLAGEGAPTQRRPFPDLLGVVVAVAQG